MVREVVETMLEGVGEVTLNVSQALAYVPKGRFKFSHLIEQITIVGNDSLPLIALISGVSGCVLSLHAAEKFAMTGANEYVGGLVALAMVREMGPIMTAFGIGARVGTAFSAEIANMSITNQIDALRVMHVSPIRYLMTPRLLGCLIALPILTVYSELIGILGGMIVAWTTIKIHPHLYISSIWHFLTWHDLEVSLIKALVFGILISGISLTIGLNTKGGARQVGLATTYATVWSAITILIADFFLTWMMFGTRLDQF